MEIQHSQLKLNHLNDTSSTKADGVVPSTKAVGGGISVVCLTRTSRYLSKRRSWLVPLLPTIIVKGGLVKCKCKSSQEQQSPNAPTTANPAPNNQLTSKQVYAQKPPRRSKKGIGNKKKNSTYNYGAARDTLGLPNSVHHY
jgi:hypothetical protein